MKTLRKCPRCCPEGRVDFTVLFNTVKCQNCWLELPRRRIKLSGNPTPSQEHVLARLRELDWEVKVKMIGRKVWVSAKHPTISWLLGNALFGTIGPAGALKITLQRVGGDIVLRDIYDVNAYLRK